MNSIIKVIMIFVEYFKMIVTVFKTLFLNLSSRYTFRARRNFIASVGVFIIFIPVFLNILVFLILFDWDIFSFNNIKEEYSKLIFKDYVTQTSPNILVLLFPIVLIFCVLRFFTFKIPNDKKQDLLTIPLQDRLFATLPYIWFIFEITHTLIKPHKLLVASILPPDYYVSFIQNFTYPLISGYANLPGLKQGITGLFIFTIEYTYIVRNFEQFSYFIRYFFMQAILLHLTFVLTGHLYFALSYNFMNYCQPALQFISLNLYSFYLVSALMLIISALTGKETKLNFIDDAILYHIGKRKVGRKKKK